MGSDQASRAELMVAVWDLTEEVTELRDENVCLREELDALSSALSPAPGRRPT